MTSYLDKTVLITGGAGGIGRCLVKTYAKKGAQVYFTDLDETKGRELELKMNQMGYKTTFHPMDSADLAQAEQLIDQVVKTYGNLHILINNVGISLFRSALEMTTEEFVKIQNVNYISGYVLTREFMRFRRDEKKEDQYGRVIGLCSTRNLMSEPDSEAYAASKGAISSLTHAFAASYSQANQTFNAISPGWIETGDYSALREEDHAQHPCGRVGRPQDIANTCLFLTEEGNNFIDGQNLYVDGGMTKKMIYIED